MAQSDARFGYRADLNRDSHNLSKRFGFTCAAGMLLPVFADIATPGDTYYINHDLTFLRTKPLAAPAMIDVKVHYESFFVPMQMIYEPIEQTIFSLKNFRSRLFGSNLSNTPINNKFPIMDSGAFVTWLKNNEPTSSLKTDAFRLFDMLGLNADMFASDANNPSRYGFSPSFFPWQICAYNCIYQYFYRLDDKSNFSNNWNLDPQFDDASSFMPATDIFYIRQRAWDFDYFTSMYRSPIVSNASMQSVLPAGNYNDLLGSFASLPVGSDGGTSSSNESTLSFTSDGNASYNVRFLQGSMSTSMLRQMFANEKLAMITGRARKTYDSQVLAHFGVKVPHDVKHDISLIGHDSYDLKIGEVTSLASTSGDTGAGLGDLAGKGWSQGNGRKHKFTAPCHGVIMTIFSVEPKKRYYGGFDRINAISDAFDIPTPEFDRLGNMPMFRYEAGERSGEGTVTDYDIIGWKERYYYSKRQHDKVTLAFMNPKTSSDTYNNLSAYMLTSAPFGAFTSTNNHTARPDLESRFYIDRNCLDGIMLVPYIANWQIGDDEQETMENWNKTPWLAYDRDQFIVDSFEKVTKVSWMSKDGEPVYSF